MSKQMQQSDASRIQAAEAKAGSGGAGMYTLLTENVYLWVSKGEIRKEGEGKGVAFVCDIAHTAVLECTH